MKKTLGEETGQESSDPETRFDYNFKEGEKKETGTSGEVEKVGVKMRAIQRQKN